MSKTAAILRWGAFGDHIFASNIPQLLKRDGYHVTYNCTWQGDSVIANNPYIDEVVHYVHDTVPNEELPAYWEELGTHYDKFVNLSGTVEGALLVPDYNPESQLPIEERRKRYDHINYYDATIKAAGYDITGKNGILYLTPEEEHQCKHRLKPYKGMFVVLWSLSGSSYHKTYPFAEVVAKRFLDRHKDAVIITVGDDLCTLLEWEHSRTVCRSGKWGIRTSLTMTKVVDCVIGTETGVLNASGCFNTPKVVLLSHSTHENLSKYWRNCIPLRADVHCGPCHVLHYKRESCYNDMVSGAPCCMAELKVDSVLEALETHYKNWRNR